MSEVKEMNRLQLSLLVSNEITQIKFGKNLASNASAFRQEFKKATGLPRNAKSIDVLFRLGLVYFDNNLEAEFLEKLNKFGVGDLITSAQLHKGTLN